VEAAAVIRAAWLAVWLVAACGGGPEADVVSPFGCGDRSCDARTHYCENVNTDVQALPSTYTCRPLPAACLPARGAPGCGCFPATTRCRGYCRREKTAGVTGFQLSCFGGG
jgi:hypothetical protein